MANISGEDTALKTRRSVDGSLDLEQGTSNLPLFAATAEFTSLCNMLSVPVDIQKKADRLLDTIMSEIDQQDQVEMSQKDMFVCALYMALIDARMPYGPHDPQLRQGHLAAPSITISQLLHTAQISVKKLLDQMRLVKELLLLSEAVGQHLVMLEKEFCIMSYLSHTFDRLCAGVFRDDDKPQLESNEENIIPTLPEMEGVTFRKKLCWFLFLQAKQRLMGDNLDLLHGFLVLLCCLEYVMRTTPSFLLNPPYDVMRIGCQNVSEYGNMPMLAKMCEQFEANREEAEMLSHTCLEPLLNELLNTDGELDLDELEEKYLCQHVKEGDLNELLFLTKHPLYSPPSSSSLSSHKQSSDTTTAALHNTNGSSNGTAPMTPVRARLSSVHQLKALLASATNQPSPKLISYFELCTHDPRDAIAERLRQSKDRFIEGFYSVMSCHSSIAETRFALGVKLYYTMLELLLDNDMKRLSVSVLDTLLKKEDFHKSLIACCLEVVLVTYGLTRSYTLIGGDMDDSMLAFPWILETLNIQAYDFSKVVESFLRAEPRLPTDVVKHLQNVEYRILEGLAWKDGSSLFDMIRVCERGTSTPAKSSPTDPLNNVGNGQLCPSAAQLYLSPVPGRSAPQTSSQQQPASVSGPRRSQSLTSFFNKVYRLAYSRLQKLCTHLQVNKDLLHKIWTCFENCITYRIDILKNRHLDQVVMCSIYGVCRVMDKEIKFKVIIREYSRIFPNAQQQVYRNVYMGGERHDSIISFYNQIFMVSMKACLLQFSTSSSRQATLRLSPVPPPPVYSPHSPAKFNLLGRKNFMVSPLKESPFKAPHSPSQLTPSTRQLYCFGDRPGSAENLRCINARMSEAKKRTHDVNITTEPKEKVKRLIDFNMAPSDNNASVAETSIIAPKKISATNVSVGCSSRERL